VDGIISVGNERKSLLPHCRFCIILYQEEAGVSGPYFGVCFVRGWRGRAGWDSSRSKRCPLCLLLAFARFSIDEISDGLAWRGGRSSFVAISYLVYCIDMNEKMDLSLIRKPFECLLANVLCQLKKGVGS